MAAVFLAFPAIGGLYGQRTSIQYGSPLIRKNKNIFGNENVLKLFGE